MPLAPPPALAGKGCVLPRRGTPCRGIPRYRGDGAGPYNGFMTTTRDHEAARVAPRFGFAGPFLEGAAPRFGFAGAFLEGLASQDFARLGGALAAGARLRALLPGGLRELAGAEVIAGQFADWFGGTEDFELVEATVGEVGGRLHLQWRLRLRAERLGAGWFTVEQHAYAGAAEDGRIARLDVLCTGYRRESRDGHRRESRDDHRREGGDGHRREGGDG